MGARWSRLAVPLLTLALGWGAAAPAVGARIEPERINVFNLKGSSGYRLLVEADPPRGEQKRGSVRITVRREGEFAAYYAPATVTESRIVAGLGTLGRVDLRFHPGGRGVARPSCAPDYPIPYVRGFYAGTVEFHGEGGYTEAGARRVRLSMHPFLDFFFCSLSVEDELDPESPGARLLAIAGRGRVAVRAVQNAPGEELKLWAFRSERRGHIRIYRSVERTFPGTAFVFDPSMQTAELRPSAPFSGSGLYRRSAGPGERWTGDLAVDFPGHPGVLLAGSQFDAALDPARWSEEPPEFHRPNLLAWPSTMPSPIASATSLLPALK